MFVKKYGCFFSVTYKHVCVHDSFNKTPFLAVDLVGLLIDTCQLQCPDPVVLK